MRLLRTLAATAALLCLGTLAACDDKPADRSDAPDKARGATGTPATGAAAATLDAAHRYIQQFASCEKLSTDPKDHRLPLTDLTTVGQWSVTERAVCSDKTEHGEIVFYMASDMKEFQARFKQHVLDKIAAGNATYGLHSRLFVGAHFAVTPTETPTALALSRSDLRILTCNPSFAVPAGYKKEPALVDGCVLSNFVSDARGKGSPVFDAPGDPAASAPADEGRPPGAGGAAQGSPAGLAKADGLAGLKALVHPHHVDCTEMSTAPEDVAVESIDYRPVVTGDARSWGVRERAVCGSLGGAGRAHNLNWLDVVSDMKTLQRKAKAAQQEDLQDGRLQATASRLMVGDNIAVETNDKDTRFGLYQLQFLVLNCEPGFHAPSGYRQEPAQVEGCVLTSYEPGLF